MTTSATAGTATESARYLTFTLNGESYALDIFHVKEILEYRTLTVVPMVPDFIRGVINLRGRAVPVIDLAIRFARGTTTVRRRTTIIIVHISESVPAAGETDGTGLARGGQDGQDIGILVDAVNKVVTLDEGDMEPAPAFGAGIRADYISGMARRDDDFLIVLDVSRVLSISDMVSLGELAREQPPPAGDAATEPR
ncbi:chemotaxis protein CheW [Actinoplanes sp. NBRC 14428]|uniref:Purine-binding chemotaxis protein CheW n=1 Tax=Pseudosporangium ferrugineum TaxID=439699 RepID=A0A2T0RXH5_9ACTN|nr:chemotaxis protein CheW [Pseudosporangium ferrugineum]PRY25743.1 purine-binding chemotaxis protein CheW [Pseudosporangium ferrugineum]BCJ56210.1 chemotaxis protein CheW [Actinoplanes sp. NBRC 14428]